MLSQRLRKVSVLCVCFFCCLFILIGCVERIYNIQRAPIVGPGRQLTLDGVMRAIVQAGKTTTIPWEMREVRPGLMIGTLKFKRHRAIVNINYSTQDFSITYRDSTLMRYDPPDRIGRHYNNWVQELEERIKANLLMEHPRGS